jgi:hypothetical protein
MPQRAREILVQRWSHRGHKSFTVTPLEIHAIGGGEGYLAKKFSVAMRGIGDGS